MWVAVTQVAERVGLPSRATRYYDRIGRVHADQRSDAADRLYRAQDDEGAPSRGHEQIVNANSCGDRSFLPASTVFVNRRPLRKRELRMPCQCGCDTTTIDERSQADVAAEGCGCDSTAADRERRLERVVAELDQRPSEPEAAR